jgi:hypothetical protein
MKYSEYYLYKYMAEKKKKGRVIIVTALCQMLAQASSCTRLRARQIPKAAGGKSDSPLAASRYIGTGGIGFSKPVTGVSGRAT